MSNVSYYTEGLKKLKEGEPFKSVMRQAQQIYEARD
jgi:hypothetical protein